MEEIIAPNRITFVAKERFILKNDITAVLEMIIEKSRIVRQSFIIKEKTKITIVNADLLSQKYTFTVEAFMLTIATSEEDQLLFSIDKEVLDLQKQIP